MAASSGAQLRYAALVPLLVVISMPFVQAFSHGQNTFTSLLFLSITVALWRGERKFLAGIVGGLLFYKPQLGAVVAAALVLDLGWKSFAGLSRDWRGSARRHADRHARVDGRLVASTASQCALDAG